MKSVNDMILPVNIARSEFAPTRVIYRVFDYSELMCRDEWKAVKADELEYYVEKHEIAETRFIDTAGLIGPAAARNIEIRIVTRTPKTYEFQKLQDAKKFVKENKKRLDEAEQVFSILFK